MKAYIIKTFTKFEPFKEHASYCLIGNRTLKELQSAILERMGFDINYVDDRNQIVDVHEYIMLGDNVYFTPELLSEFFTEAIAAQRSCICALKKGATTLRTATKVQNVQEFHDYFEYDLQYCPDVEYRNRLPQSIIIDPQELSATLPVPKHMTGVDSYDLPLTEKVIIQIDHWVNLWIANIMEIMANGARLQRSSFGKKLWLALKARSFNKWKVSQANNKIGKKCDIHHAAMVEGSVVGDNVEIGMGSIVRNSIIGANVRIGNGVVIEESVIGDGSSVLNGRVIFSVFGPNCFSVSEMVPAAYLGRDCFLAANSTMCDLRLDDNNTAVMKDGVPVDSGNRFLSSCLGHEVWLGTGVTLAPGRSIPHGIRIAVAEEKIIRKVMDGQAEIEGFRLVRK